MLPGPTPGVLCRIVVRPGKNTPRHDQAVDIDGDFARICLGIKLSVRSNGKLSAGLDLKQTVRLKDCPATMLSNRTDGNSITGIEAQMLTVRLDKQPGIVDFNIVTGLDQDRSG